MPDAMAIDARLVTGGRRSAPAKGGTSARTPGMNRLRKSDAAPYLPCSSREPALALLVGERRKAPLDPRGAVAPADEVHRRRAGDVADPRREKCPERASLPARGEPAPERDDRVRRDGRKDVLDGGEQRHDADTARASGMLDSQAMRPDVMAYARYERRGGETGESFAAADEAHPLVRLALDADVRRRRIPTRARRSARASPARCGAIFGVSAMTTTSSCPTRQPSRSHARHGEDQHLDRVAAGVRGIGVGEHPADVAECRGAEHRVGHGVRDRVAVRVAVQMHVGRISHAAEHERSARLEAVRVVADPGAEREPLSHGAAPRRRRSRRGHRRRDDRVVLPATRRREARRRG